MQKIVAVVVCVGLKEHADLKEGFAIFIPFVQPIFGAENPKMRQIFNGHKYTLFYPELHNFAEALNVWF